jgi:hypothetical protein
MWLLASREQPPPDDTVAPPQPSWAPCATRDDRALMTKLAVIRDMDSLQAALRERANGLTLNFNSLDQECQFPERYTSKLLAPIPVKTLGRQSLGPLLACCGVELWLVERPDALAAYTSRIETRKRPLAREGMRARRKTQRVGDSEWGREMQNHWMLKTSPAQRKRSARIAALARWAAVRAAKVTPVKTGSRNGGSS